MSRSIVSVLTLALALAVSGCAPSTTSTTAETPANEGTPASGKSDIVDTAASAGSFKTLLAAVKAADLEGTLRGAGPFTVFAPTDEAFAKLPPGTVDDLLKPENKEKLKAVLTYHVVAGNVGSEQAMKLTTAATVNGKSLALEVKGSDLHVGKGKVVKADIGASNGVIHVVDTVLIPE